MTDRILDISEEAAQLNVRYEQLIMKRDNREDVSVPLADIAVIVVSQPRVTFTLSVLSGIAKTGGMFIVCDEKHLPTGMMLPLQTHHLQAERFGLQVESSAPARKRLWQQIVRAKIRAQSRLLAGLHGSDSGISALVPQVRSGDPQNVEARASRRYWPALFGDEFRRRRNGDPPNNFLNYGYAILRAVTARAICAAGLHPSIGLHHHNRYDAFVLADDLMEPLRPIVDGATAEYVKQYSNDAQLDRQGKSALILPLLGRFNVEGESRTLFDIVSRTAISLVAAFAGERKNLFLPEI